ncbi:alpha-amylase family glycosyl hydrolase, partial [Lactobacillus delbrueckii]
LMATAKDLGIKVVMDLVVNHTSDQHRWFQAALKNPASPYRDFYIFRQGHDGQQPNNWRSNFGAGSSWTAVPGEPNTYYHHVFSPQQPDLNW